MAARVKIAPVPVPARTPARSRQIAELRELIRVVEALPEPACRILEEARILPAVRAQLVTLANASNAAVIVGDIFRSLGNLQALARR